MYDKSLEHIILPNELIQFLYSRSFDQLPNIMKPGGNRKAQIWLPQEGIIRPCGHGDSFDDFDVSAYYGIRASRGVRKRQQARANAKILVNLISSSL